MLSGFPTCSKQSNNGSREHGANTMDPIETFVLGAGVGTLIHGFGKERRPASMRSLGPPVNLCHRPYPGPAAPTRQAKIDEVIPGARRAALAPTNPQP
jgi:hypothetical protein